MWDGINWEKGGGGGGKYVAETQPIKWIIQHG